MHPAPSVIAFTTLSGAGYGALAVYGTVAAAGIPGAATTGARVLLLTAFVLVSAGLLASTAHLGHPERAWRAFSQWRSSWLSREGVAAVVTYVPLTLLVAWQWQWLSLGALAAPLQLLLAALSVTTVVCTAMIYASLKSIRQWHDRRVPAIYLGFAVASGALLAQLMLGDAMPAAVVATLIAASWALKWWYWLKPGRDAGTTIQSATGLGGDVRPFDPPHTEASYLTNELGFRLARKHAGRLRRLATLAGAAVPVVACFVLAQLKTPAPLLAGLAFGSYMAGVLIERWLFFAEAEHTVMLYYGGARH
ncbi:MAG: DmsC/YnfH family molybdoenzyme membrane anchor subunit [Pseudomonadota bacterium]